MKYYTKSSIFGGVLFNNRDGATIQYVVSSFTRTSYTVNYVSKETYIIYTKIAALLNVIEIYKK